MADKRAEPLIDGKPLSSLRVVDLKQELEKRGISKSGSKKDLVDRLRTRLELEQLQQQPLEGSQVPNISVAQGLQEPNDFVKAYLADQQETYQRQLEAARQQQFLAQSVMMQATDFTSQANNIQQQPVPVEVIGNQQMEVKTVVETPKVSQESLPKKIEVPSSISPQKSSVADTQSTPRVTEVPSPEKLEPSSQPVQRKVPESPSKTEKHVTPQKEEPVSKPIESTPVAPKDSPKKPTPTKSVEDNVSQVEKKTQESPVKQPEVKQDTQKKHDSHAKIQEDKKTEEVAGKSPSKTSPVKERVEEKKPVEDLKKTEEKKEEVKKTEDIKRSDDDKKEEDGRKDGLSLKLKDRKSSTSGQDENRSRSKRKWGSSSETSQRSRGITSSELNSLLPRESNNNNKVSTGTKEGHEESQGDSLEVDQNNLASVDKHSMSSGKFSSTGGSTSVKKSMTASQEDVDKETDIVSRSKENDNKDQVEEIQVETNGDPVVKEQSPARNPPSKVLFVQNLTRPLTLNGLHALLKKYGNINTERFWIDKIKSKCLVTFTSVEEAENARKELHGLRWPDSNPKTLATDFSTDEEIDARRKADEAPPVPSVQDKEVIRKTIENDKAVDKRHLREWDKDKKLDEEDAPPEKRRRSRSPGDKHERDHESKKEKKEEPLQELPQESSAKLLDDLFKKTTATPVIYWLPLTEQDALERVKEREVREQKRREDQAAREAESRARYERRSPPKRRDRSPPRGGYRGGPPLDRRRTPPPVHHRPPPGRGGRGRSSSKSYSRSRSRSPRRASIRRSRSPVRRSPVRRSPPRRR